MNTDSILKLILEKLEGINDRLGVVESRLEGIDDRLGVVESRLEGIDDRLGVVESRLEGIDERLGAVESRQDKLENRVGAIFEQTAILTEFKISTEAALSEINKTIESKYDLILRDIELVAGEQGKQRIDIARLKAVTGER